MPPRALILGIGRDGTTSASILAQSLLEANGDSAAAVGHETNYEALWPAIGSYVRQKSGEPFRDYLNALPTAVESSVGFAFVLPVLLEVLGPRVPVLRLVRNEEDLIVSNVKRVAVRPWFWGGYVAAEQCLIERPTAPEFGEATAEEWASWPLHRRVRWYVRKNRELLDDGLDRFERAVALPTKALGTYEGIERVAEALGVPVAGTVAPVHSNSGPQPTGWADAERRIRADLRRWDEESG